MLYIPPEVCHNSSHRSENPDRNQSKRWRKSTL